MTTSSVVLLLVLGGALFAVLGWGFRRAGDGPGVTAVQPRPERGHESQSR